MERKRYGIDISKITEKLAIGAAPRSEEAIMQLKSLGFERIIDLRAERKKYDPLSNGEEFLISWVPTYDDWEPKSFEFFEELENQIIPVLKNSHFNLLICCGAGEHRAPLAGVLALASLGYSLEAAAEIVQKARPQAELLPVYMSSLKQFLESTNQASRNGFVRSIG